MQLTNQIGQSVFESAVGSEFYWSFKGRSKREHCHKLLTYPAVMVPQMQGELIDELLRLDENISTIYDPFVGSGTVLVESMLRGKQFIGTDINPLSILCCEVKSDPFYEPSLKNKIDDLFYRLSYTTTPPAKLAFSGIDKWYLKEAQKLLNIIRSCIQEEPSKWARRFFWLALAETANKFSNSRPTTFKLHIKAEEDLVLDGNPLTFFKEKVEANFNLKKSLHEQMSVKNLVKSGRLLNKVKVRASDTRFFKLRQKADLIVTSPPYGDNQTTVTYGQYSYLPLKWIDLDDLKEKVNDKLLDTQSGIDSASLGGQLKNWESRVVDLCALSTSFEETFEAIKSKEKRGERKLTGFIWDLYVAYRSMSENLRINGYVMITLGNRQISKVEVPLEKISKELLDSIGFQTINDLKRKILNKRMASRNNHSETMSCETVLIMKKN